MLLGQLGAGAQRPNVGLALKRRRIGAQEGCDAEWGAAGELLDRIGDHAMIAIGGVEVEGDQDIGHLGGEPAATMPARS